MNVLISRLKKHIKSRLKWGKEASTEEIQVVIASLETGLFCCFHINRSEWNKAASSKHKQTARCYPEMMQNYSRFTQGLRFGEYPTCPTTSLDFSHRDNEWPF